MDTDKTVEAIDGPASWVRMLLLCRVILRHLEGDITYQQGPGGRHFHVARGRAGRHSDCDFGRTNDTENRRRAIECDAACGAQMRAENLNCGSHPAGRWNRLHKGAQSLGKCEHGAIVV